MRDLGVIERISTIWSAEATSNRSVEIAYPGISTWKITAIGRTAHPTEPEKGINAIVKMADLVRAIDDGRLKLPAGNSQWFVPRVTTNAIRTLPGGGWAIPARCDAVLSILSPSGTTLNEVRDAIAAFLEELRADDTEVRFEFKVLPMGAGRLWLRPGEVDPEHVGVKALTHAIATVRGGTAVIKEFNGGWVDGAELMSTGDGRVRYPGDDHVRPRGLRARPHRGRAHRIGRGRPGGRDLCAGHARAAGLIAQTRINAGQRREGVQTCLTRLNGLRRSRRFGA